MAQGVLGDSEGWGYPVGPRCYDQHLGLNLVPIRIRADNHEFELTRELANETPVTHYKWWSKAYKSCDKMLSYSQTSFVYCTLLLTALVGVVYATSSLQNGQWEHQCGNTTTFCSNDGTCCDSEYSPTKYGCRNLVASDSYCCKPGPSIQPIVSLPNCLVIGDSVSIGYTPIAAKILESVCQLQHGPFDVSNGGAGDTSYGLHCLPNFLVTQRQTPVMWDLILFNFGLHNLVNTDVAKAQYRKDLLSITMQLVLRMPSAKLIYATTTPYMTDALQNNSIVEDLNDIARDMLREQFSSKSIDILDLYKVVTDHWYVKLACSSFLFLNWNSFFAVVECMKLATIAIKVHAAFIIVH